ncbi:MAG TPA: dienelactone hydrolase family protein [Vicinamibacteria bacterium]|nr:dienelactone hydrolase family protein [Vicinamibacteria bacterium]
MSKYDPFARGSFPVGVRTVEARDGARSRLFPVEIWYPAAAQHAGQDLTPETQDVFAIPAHDAPRRQMAVRNAAAQPGSYPLIVFSHGSASGARRMSTFVCSHLSSHGYVVAALDHSEVVAAELARRDGETDEQKAARVEALIGSRVPDVRFLLDYLLDRAPLESETKLDPMRIGIVGYSFGGWTALAATAVEWRIRAVVALAPGGSSRPKPGILPGKLTFAWGRDVPTLYLVAENDVMTPLAGMHELFERTPATKRMVILRRADHIHFLDDVEREHEAARSMKWAGALAWISEEMRPVAELCSGGQAHLFVRGLTVGHMDDVLKGREEARQFWAADVQTELATRGVEGIAYQPSST